MRKTFLTLLLPLALSAGNVTMTGWISDAACTTGNAGGEAAKRECAKRCIDGGEAPVFVADKDSKVYRVNDAAKAKAHLTSKVKLTGNVKGDLFEIESIEDTK